ncbi:hypothetical protein HYQ46_004150 [Verticillium longisporum]|nr:hypothetical protein HYQ46_004150 [Verticillium longisporum]
MNERPRQYVICRVKQKNDELGGRGSKCVKRILRRFFDVLREWHPARRYGQCQASSSADIVASQGWLFQ